jgi:serine/threonine-protein phosphatase PGAM5
MAVRYVYLVRHGHYISSHEADNRGGGLSDIGRQQADLTAETMSKFPLAEVFCSSMRRTFETAERIAIRHGKVPQAFDTLREIIPCIPPGEEALFVERFPDLTPEKMARERRAADKAFDRFFQSAADEVIHEAVISHGNIIRYFVCRVLNAPIELWTKMETNHCGITRCAVEDGKFRLISLNDTGHLPIHLQLFT